MSQMLNENEMNVDYQALETEPITNLEKTEKDGNMLGLHSELIESNKDNSIYGQISCLKD